MSRYHINFTTNLLSEFSENISNSLESIHKRAQLDDKLLSISFVDDEMMQKLNRDYRKKDASTDVLTFLFDDEEILGDIYISIPTIKKNALEHKVDFMQEMNTVIAHAFAHLKRYTHDTDEQEQKMIEYERFLLNLM